MDRPALARRARWCVATIAIAMAVPRAALAVDHPLRLEDAVQLALSKNERAKIAEAQVRVADAALERAHAAFLPTLATNAVDTIHPNTTATTPTNTVTGGATLSQPILNASAWPLLRQAERLLDAQRASSTDAKRVLMFDAAAAFFNALNQEEIVQAAQHRLDSANANLIDTQSRFEAQLVSSNDVTRAQVEVASAQQERANDEGTRTRAYQNLSFVLATPLQGSLETPDATLRAAAVPIPSLEPLIAQAESRRLDLVAAKHNARAAHLFADEPLLRIVPTFGIAAALTANSAAPASARSTDETVSGTLTWILYDAGVRYADKHSRDASADIADLQEQTLMRQIETDVRNAAASLFAAQAALRAANDGVIASRKSVDETTTLYKQGLAKAIELTDANDARFLAEVSYATTELTMALAYLALREAMGLDPIGTVLS